MIELKPQDRLFPEDDRGFPLVRIVWAVLIIAALGGGVSYWYFGWRTPNFNDVYGRLGIASLPSSVERQPQIQKRLSQLSREPCYVDAILGLSEELFEAEYPRESAMSF